MDERDMATGRLVAEIQTLRQELDTLKELHAANMARITQSEQALGKSEERNRLLSEVTMEGILIHRSGIAFEVNSSLVMLLGYQYEELINKDFLEIVYPDDRALVRQNIIKEYAAPYEIRVYRKNGELFFAEIESRNIEYQKEKWRVTAIRDITERKQSEAVIRMQAEMLDTAPSAITVHDNHGNFLYSNQKNFELHGYDKAEFMKMNLHELDVPESESMLAERFLLINKEGSASFEVAHYHKDGSIIPLEIFAKTVEWHGNQAVLSIATDITERNQAQEEIWESEANLRALFDAVNESVFLMELDGTLISINETTAKRLGATPVRMIGRKVYDFLPPDLIDWRKEQVEVVRKTGKPVRFEDFRNGIWLDNSICPIRNSEGQVARLAIIGTDITDRKNSEFELVKAKEDALMNQERFETYIMSSPTSVFLADKDGHYTFVNNSGCNLLGYSREELMKLSIMDVLRPGHEEEDMEIFQELRRSGEIRNIEIRLVKKGGQMIDVILDGKRLSDNEFIAFKKDISDRKRAENALTDSKNRLESIFLVAPTGIGVVRNRMIEDVNPKLCLMTGYTREELIGMDARMLYPSVDDYNYVGQEKYRQIHESGTGVVETKWIRKDGTIIDILLSSTWISPSKTDRGTTFTALDITDRKKLEHELIKAKDKAEESDRLKSAFLANMSHEIRTPMNGILGFAELLKEPDIEGTTQQQYIEIIERSGARLLNTINEIIDISKIESGQTEVRISNSDINEQMEFIYNFFKPEAEIKGLMLSYKATLPSNESTIRTDREKLFAILTNLVKNALKYTHQGSIDFGYDKKDDLLEFYISDTGIGIPEHRQKVVFERFVQSDSADKSARQGAGLGLAIARAYTEMLGGTIRVESVEGKGSTFRFTLPYPG